MLSTSMSGNEYYMGPEKHMLSPVKNIKGMTLKDVKIK